MGLQLLTDRARHIRRHNAELRLSGLLRSRPLKRYRFRRQHVVGPFIVDFICIEHAFIIELVNHQHALGLPADSNRKLLLESLGFRVLRLWDSEVLSDPKTALRRIVDALTCT
jgi:very-short-patch-repair endonuclease